MSENSSLNQAAAWKKTQLAYLWTSVLNTPFWAIFNMLPFILYKELHATPLQVTSIIILKPTVSLFAVYWSALIEKRKDRLIANLIWARAISHLPFFFFPFVDNPWFFIASFGLYMMLSRGTVPAWMEILKLNIPDLSRKKIFAYASTLGYIGAAVIPFAMGSLLDSYIQFWRWIFPATALVSLLAILFKSRIPIHLDMPKQTDDNISTISWKLQLMKPWKNAWELICRRPDFVRFQFGFMLGGSGLIVMQPALPGFFMDKLSLSYTELAFAMTLCKGIGFAMASSLWARLMSKINIYLFNSWVTLFAFLFPMCLLAAQINLAWLYIGYLLYGMMQAGSEMSWNLSGPLFAKDEDSSVYSSLNVLTVGIRGCFVPAIGSLLAYQFHASGVLILGGALCLFSSYFMARCNRRLSEVPQGSIAS